MSAEQSPMKDQGAPQPIRIVTEPKSSAEGMRLLSGIPELVRDPRRFPDGAKLMVVDLPSGLQRTVPVFNAREDRHHEPIAQLFQSGHAGVAFGVGLYGISSMVEDPHSPRNPEGAEAFFRTKSGRTAADKIPMYLPPEEMLEYMDITQIHPSFRPLFASREAREWLWETGVALHIIGPVREGDSRVHDVFITTPDIAKQKFPNAPDKQQPVSTAAFFWWDDPDWLDIARRTGAMNPYAISGISSFNRHKQAPAWDFEDVGKFVAREGIVPFEFIVEDPIGEQFGVRSSFTQLGVPLVGQEPNWIVYRTGPTDINRFVGEVNDKFGTNFGIRGLETSTPAASGEQPEGTDLHERMLELQRSVRADYDRRHPRSRSVRE